MPQPDDPSDRSVRYDIELYATTGYTPHDASDNGFANSRFGRISLDSPKHVLSCQVQPRQTPTVFVLI